jgi:opacity protein-like surface antigen
MIRFLSTAIILSAVISSFAFAQDSTPKVQVFGGYSLVHVTSGGLNGPAIDEDLHQYPNTFGVASTFQGWNAEGQYNATQWVGIAIDAGERSGTPITAHGAGGLPTFRAYSLMVGPVLSYRAMKKLTPFAHALAGWDRASLNATNITGLLSPISTQASNYTDFAVALGGGVDYNLSHHFTLRLAQLDWFHTSINLSKLYSGAFGPGEFEGLSTRQVNLRFSTGIVVRF